jgi:hypothetical protein
MKIRLRDLTSQAKVVLYANINQIIGTALNAVVPIITYIERKAP